jgi:hypothetical protein
MKLHLKVSQIIPVYKPLRVLKSNNNNILPFKPESSKSFLPFGFKTETLYAFSFFKVRATCPAQLISYDLLTRMIFGKEF